MMLYTNDNDIFKKDGAYTIINRFIDKSIDSRILIPTVADPQTIFPPWSGVLIGSLSLNH